MKLSDFNAYAFLNLRVPNPVTIQAELMALSLSEYRSARSYELVKRQELAALYREFLRYEELRLRYEESLNSFEENSGILKSSDLVSRVRKANESKVLQLRLRKSLDQTSFRISKMLQLSDYKIRPRIDELPNISYNKQYKTLEIVCQLRGSTPKTSTSSAQKLAQYELKRLSSTSLLIKFGYGV